MAVLGFEARLMDTGDYVVVLGFLGFLAFLAFMVFKQQPAQTPLYVPVPPSLEGAKHG
jgi:hypothetical protein